MGSSSGSKPSIDTKITSSTPLPSVALVERIGLDNVFVHLDTFHMNMEEKGVANGIIAARDHLKYMHMSESDRGTPGYGNVPWDAIFSALAAIGFKGALTLESFAAMPSRWPVPSPHGGRLPAMLRRFSKMAVLPAQQGCSVWPGFKGRVVNMADAISHNLDVATTIATASAECFNTPGRTRILVAIAGAPGSGKSTLAEQVVDLLTTQFGLRAALFPMDGYHYDDAVLNEMGRRAFKGAIDTFDAHGLRHMLQRLKANEDDVIAVPVFDRSIEIARAGGRLIPQTIEVIVCEGNYLLALQPPWDRLKSIFDLTIFVDVHVEELRVAFRTGGAALVFLPRRSPGRWKRTTCQTAFSSHPIAQSPICA